MALANTPFRTLLDKNTQRQFTIEMKPYNVNGSSFSKFFSSYISNNWEERLQNLNDEALIDKFYADKLYSTCRNAGSYEMRCTKRAELGRKLIVYLRLAAKAKVSIDRKEQLNAAIDGKVEIDALKAMLPNVHFERCYHYGKPRNWKLYLKKGFDPKNPFNSGYRCFNQYAYLYEAKYFDPATVIAQVKDLAVKQAEYYEYLLKDLKVQQEYVTDLSTGENDND